MPFSCFISISPCPSHLIDSLIAPIPVFLLLFLHFSGSQVLYNILLQPSLALEWDPTLAGSRLLGCFYQDQTVVNILQLCYRTIPGTFGSFLKNPKVQLCRAAWRNQNSTEAIILMKSLKTPSLPAQITVSTFAFQLKVIDGKSCLLTHVLDQSSRGTAWEEIVKGLT